ncbi:D-3-phosphoglycerate dehydrogenase [Strongyloides ratti]|uniref:D-3-phosphoglycerate dehydrogenase n=1 Tax=Strongyloides ratti TaxID=34506 RepID=A0A090LKM4_STRRB|nr:D-3-phosphoglycerate dehydrogenase [Strongyloides ratti]CEF70248.1 D-3-phosphoglycerate dehydrogenase [Strongyloides ratti]
MTDETGTTTLNLFSQQFDLYSLLQKAASVNNTSLSPKNQDLTNNDNNNLFPSSPISQIKGTLSPVSSPVNSNANTSASSNSNDSAPSLLSMVKMETRKPLTEEEIRKERAKFTPITPIYVPTGHGRQVLIYDSKSHPGHRREFSYKTQFTNQAGCTTVYYRCLGCRTLRRHLQNMLPAESLPAVPCIAVKNGVLINNPDYPEAADHFCQPPTISQSDERFRTGKRRNTMRNRLKKSTLEQHINLAQFNTNLPEGVDEKTKIREILKNLSTNLYQSPILPNPTSLSENNGTGENNHNNKDDIINHNESTSNILNNSSSVISNSSILDDSGTGTFNFNLFESLTKQANQQVVANLNQSFLATMFGNTSTITPQIQNNKKESSKNSKTSKLDSLLEMVEMKHNNESNTSLKDESTDEELSTEKKDTPTPNESLWDSIISKTSIKTENDSNKASINFNIKSFVVEILLRYVKNNYEVPEDEQTTRKMADFICSLLLSLSNNLYFTINNIKNRSWNNIETAQEGLHGKVLALVGLGRCTSELVTRMKAFGMRIIGYDPNGITVDEHIKKLITIMSFYDILSMADYIVINVPLTASTLNMFTKDIFFKCKKYCKIVNASPRGIVNEGALQHVLEKTSIIERIALQIEPADCTIPEKIMRNEKVICVSNPFIRSDRLNAISSLVESVSSLNNGTGFFDKMTNVNGLILDEIKECYIKSTIQLSQIVQALKPSSKEILIKYPQMLLPLQNAFRAGGVVGIMRSMDMVGQNLAITEALANNMGIKVKVLAHSSLEFAVISGTTSVTGYTSPGGTVITTINSHKLPVTLFASGNLAITLENTEPFGENNGLVYGEYSLIGGKGKVLVLGDITPEQKKLIEEKLIVVQF